MKCTRALILMPLVLLIGGCAEQSSNDQCLRAELFQACMRSLPAGPTSTRYNDWDEVVSQCESVAYLQSKRLVSQIKPECKS